MSSYNGYESVVDSSQVEHWLDKMADESYQRRVLYKAIMDGAKVLQENTKESFRRKVGEASTHFSNDVGGPFYDGVMLKGDRAYLEGRVSIMKDYRMKWFEKGTRERFTSYRINKRGEYRKTTNASGTTHSTGKMKPLYFFRDARNNSAGQIEEAITQSINNAYLKLQNQ